jgi:hypothetical protein
MWLYPELTPDEMTPVVKTLLASIAQKDHRLAELNLRRRLSRTRLGEVWRNAGRPITPAPSYLHAAAAGVSSAECSDKVEQLIYTVAALDHAINELEHPRRGDFVRRSYRRTLGGIDLVAAKLAGRPRRVFGQR